MRSWEQIEGNLATPGGFSAAAAAAGIKKIEGALDLALIFSDQPETAAAGTFTSNVAAAAPVLFSRRNLKASRGRARAIVVSSGNANACTGRDGMRIAEATARAAAKLVGIPARQVLVASTGVIGVPLPLDRILNQLPGLREKLSAENASAVQHAIMTTDTFPKSCVLRTKMEGTAVHLAGIAKGAGMIHPHMATMLCFVTTDVAVEPQALSRMLRTSVGASFNRISVDGDTSTNDTVIALASGFSRVKARPGNSNGRLFLSGLTQLCQTLAQLIARDGEGAKKFITVEVLGARNDGDAERIARTIANSPLVKTAIAGSDPNWGRIMCAAGYSGAKFDPTRVDISINGFVLCRKGLDAGFNEAEASQQLDAKDLTLVVNLHQGSGSAHFWTCDLTYDYITINASYRT